jgi:hypothetical protein
MQRQAQRNRWRVKLTATLHVPSDGAGFPAKAFDGLPEFSTEMRPIGATDIAQLDSLQVRPEPFAGVQLRGIGGQTLQVESISRPRAQARGDGVTAMNRGAIPNDHQAVGSNPPPARWPRTF